MKLGKDFVYYLFLFLQHFVKYGQDPVFKLDVVVIRNEKVAYPVYPFFAEVTPFQSKVAHVRRSQALDEIFLYPSGSRYYAVYL